MQRAAAELRAATYAQDPERIRNAKQRVAAAAERLARVSTDQAGDTTHQHGPDTVPGMVNVNSAGAGATVGEQHGVIRSSDTTVEDGVHDAVMRAARWADRAARMARDHGDTAGHDTPRQGGTHRRNVASGNEHVSAQIGFVFRSPADQQPEDGDGTPSSKRRAAGRDGGVGPVSGEDNLTLVSPQGPVHISTSSPDGNPGVVGDVTSDEPRPRPENRGRGAAASRARARAARDAQRRAARRRRDTGPVDVIGDGRIVIDGRDVTPRRTARDERGDA
ncbi:hypothetical protein [Actinophytocola sediminis]